MTLEQLKTLCAEKATLIDDPADPSIRFVLVMVKFQPDGAAHVTTATTCDPLDAQHALRCAINMTTPRPPAPTPPEHLS